jgi:hypothetical protein
MQPNSDAHFSFAACSLFSCLPKPISFRSLGGSGNKKLAHNQKGAKFCRDILLFI